MKPQRNIPLGLAFDLVLLSKLHKLGPMTKLQLMHRGVSTSTIRLLKKHGILSTTEDDNGTTHYKVVDDFLGRLTR